MSIFPEYWIAYRLYDPFQLIVWPVVIDTSSLSSIQNNPSPFWIHFSSLSYTKFTPVGSFRGTTSGGKIKSHSRYRSKSRYQPSLPKEDNSWTDRKSLEQFIFQVFWYMVELMTNRRPPQGLSSPKPFGAQVWISKRDPVYMSLYNDE